MPDKAAWLEGAGQGNEEGGRQGQGGEQGSKQGGEEGEGTPLRAAAVG